MFFGNKLQPCLTKLFILITKVNPHLFEHLGTDFNYLIMIHDEESMNSAIMSDNNKLLRIRKIWLSRPSPHFMLNSQTKDTNNFHAMSWMCVTKNKKAMQDCYYNVKVGRSVRSSQTSIISHHSSPDNWKEQIASQIII